MVKLAKHWDTGNDNQPGWILIADELTAPSGPTEAVSHRGASEVYGAFQRDTDKSL